LGVAFSEDLADQIRLRIGSRPGLSEKEMFGGIAFMIRGNMAVGVSGDDLMVRVGKEAHEEALTRPGARTFDMTGRPMAGWVLIAPEGTPTEEDLDLWVNQGLKYAESLPPK
jgi:TfoX/Sxy family transcriptional regulator of competence genes